MYNLASLRASVETFSESLGHLLSGWEKGIHRGAILAECSTCGYFAVVDLQVEPPVFGAAAEVPCHGRSTIPSWAPAR